MTDDTITVEDDNVPTVSSNVPIAKSGGRWSPKQRQRALGMCLQGISKAEVSRRLNIPVRTIKSWFAKETFAADLAEAKTNTAAALDDGLRLEGVDIARGTAKVIAEVYDVSLRHAGNYKWLTVCH